MPTGSRDRGSLYDDRQTAVTDSFVDEGGSYGAAFLPSFTLFTSSLVACRVETN